MSELINTHDNRATIRWKLLTGVSALALTATVSSAGLAHAEDGDRPQIWIELGGELDMMHGLDSPFTAPFMTAITPTPGPYRGNVFDQKSPRFALDFDSKISFQPEDSDWIFFAGIRYGRSHSNKHAHHQTTIPGTYTFGGITYTGYFVYASPFADTKSLHQEKHAILDFSAGKDVGLGLLGHEGTSTLNAGVRFAQFTSNSSLHITARPSIYYTLHFGPFVRFHQYMLSGHAERGFKGIGPSLSWEGSAALAGNKQDGELTLDLGVNAALLFGRQTARTDHATSAYYENQIPFHPRGRGFHPLYAHGPYHSTRSKRVTVPNIGGSAGVSFKYPNFKFSVGYRYDTFLDAMDTGIDAAKKSNLTFNGPYASISIGLGD